MVYEGLVMAIWSTIGKALGSVAGSLIGAGGSIAGAGLSYSQQKALQANQAKINYEYAEKSARNTPTWNRAGLESAGYNPMLAVQNSTSGANASWTSAQSANSPDISGGLTQGLANAQSFQRLKNETQQAESATDSNYATADELKSRKAINIAKLPFVSKREKAEIAESEARAAKLENDIHYQDEMINYYKNSLKLQEMGLQPQFINAGANATNAETNKLQYEIDKEVQDIIRDREKRYKEWGDKYPALRNIDETLTRYFNGFGATASKSSVSKR